MPLIRSIVKGRWGYFFIGPAYVLFTIFTIYPLFEGIRLSFYDAGLKMRTWVGFENYARLLTDSAFRRAFLTILWSSSFGYPGALLFAVLIFGLNVCSHLSSSHLPSVPADGACCRLAVDLAPWPPELSYRPWVSPRLAR